jgi:hypothetical protein
MLFSEHSLTINLKRRKKMKQTLTLLTTTLILLSTFVQAAEFHVSTPESFQAALATAANNGGDDRIFLAAGMYYGNFRYLAEEANSLTIQTENGVQAGEVVLDGGKLAYVLMIGAEDLEADFYIQGIRCQNGDAINGGGLSIVTKGHVEIVDCFFVDNIVTQDGGGVYISDAFTVTFTGNTFNNNNSSSSSSNGGGGGGAYIFNGSTVTFTGNTFNNNSSSKSYGGGAYIYKGSTVTFTGNTFNNNSSYGGGAYINNGSTVTFTDNTFTNNRSSSNIGGGAHISKGSTVTFTDNIFTNNSSSGVGGGAYIYSFSTVTFTGNTFNNNSSSNIGGGAYIYSGSTVTFTGNTFNNNSSRSYGGGGCIIGSTVNFTGNTLNNNSSKSYGGCAYITLKTALNCINNTISQNISENNGAGLCVTIPETTGTFNIHNNIIWNNTSQEDYNDIYIEGFGQELTAHNNIFSDAKAFWTDASNNRDIDPLFFDPDNNDFHLKPNSPCINAGNPNSPELPEFDLDGNPRIGLPDIGAYEFSNSTPHPADIDNNWTIDAQEFQTYNTHWKTGQIWNDTLIPIDYVTIAGWIYKKGTQYGNTGAGKPQCWVPNQ